ncbi:MAG: DNA mismatch repair protein MutS [Rhodothermales bacterium]
MASSTSKKSSAEGTMTPLMRQYYKIKERHADAILLFRMGDFYETFESDAETVSQVLGITLTKRSNGKASEVPLAGFPHHALDNYLPKLVQAGYRVAVCEQLEDPKFARKIVKRDVVEVVTPGVSFHEQLLHPKQANYLAAVHWGTRRVKDDTAGVAYLDATTGEFALTEVPASGLLEYLHMISPAEVLIDKRRQDDIRWLRARDYLVTPQEDWCFGYDFGLETLLRHFKTHSLKGFGVESFELGIVAAGAALYYLNETQKGRLPHISRLIHHASDAYMALDVQTKRNLELVSSMQHGRQEGSLVQILDQTVTPIGARRLRRWLLQPLRKVEAIQHRLHAVRTLVEASRLREQLRAGLRPIGDLERLGARLATGRATPRDMVAVRAALEIVPVLQQLLAGETDPGIAELAGKLDPCPEVATLIREAIVDEPPATLADGGVFRPGYNAELDELRALTRSGKDWVARMQKEESVRTGIPSLKVGFNKVFGYYIEITHAHRDKVPDDYIRKQTLVNAERYITPALKEYEEKILTSEERMLSIESSLYHDLRQRVAEFVPVFQRNADSLSQLDCLASFAETAVKNRYVMPEIDASRRLDIEEGRHPVVERLLPAGQPFIANSVALDPETHQILIITGPNMAGKSVILRQVGLIVLLAQVGCFVPARRARIGVVDRIFTRVGASDNLASGESTFLVEMNEAANILNNASPASLILLDELGRGTSTFDGLSIAWSLVEFLHQNDAVAARTLFATHYHELNELAGRYDRIVNMRVQVKEHDGKVIFLHKLIPGGADHSYGIEVARMAGLPDAVIRRAQEILQQLESQRLEVGAGDGSVAGPPAIKAIAPQADDRLQLSLFEMQDPQAQRVADAVRRMDPDRLTPVEALLKLVELKQLLS